jgi:hypothetical protein
MSDKLLTKSVMTLALPLLAMPVFAYDVTDRLSIGGVLAGTAQCQSVSDAPGTSDSCESAAVLQPELSYRPTPADEVFFKLGFAAGNGLNGVSPFVIAPWAADLEDDVTNLNGRNRNYLLTAWYKHTFQLGNDQQLGATVGIIDATDYLDDNAYANDEYTQFMNATLSNAPNVFLPSYDQGLVLEWEAGPWSMNGVLMSVGDNDDGNSFSFYGLQAGYSVNNKLGAGNYRLIVAGSSNAFLDPTSSQLESLAGMLFSLDQEFGSVVGGWVRIGWQTDEAAVDYSAIYSGGINLKGIGWGRANDTIGLGLVYLSGGNQGIDSTQVAEVYYRWQIGDLRLAGHGRVLSTPVGIPTASLHFQM